MFSKHSLLYVLIIFIFLGCSNNHEKDKTIIPRAKLVSIICDIEKSQSYIDIVPDTLSQNTMQNKKAFREEVFKKYKITENQYNESIEYYSSVPDSLDKLMNDVLKKLDKDAS